MTERYQRLNTCDDVRALDVGESLTLDYKEAMISRRDLAAAVCGFANTQGGILVFGVADPNPEGRPPKTEDFVGVPYEEDLVKRIEDQLLDSISPRVFPRIKSTEDTFKDDGVEKCFLLIDVPQSSQLHQVTVKGDFRFYRRGEYQTRRMAVDEVQLRVESIIDSRARVEQTFQKELERIEEITSSPYMAFLASPVTSHYLTTDLADLSVRVELSRLGWGQEEGEWAGPIPSNEMLQPAGDGARQLMRTGNQGVLLNECRVRRDSLLNHIEVYRVLDNKPYLVEREAATADFWRGVGGDVSNAGQGRYSTMLNSATAVNFSPRRPRSKVGGFLDFVRGVYDLGGYCGPVRFLTILNGYGSFPARSVSRPGYSHLLRITETPEVRAETEFDYDSLLLQREALVDDMMRRVAQHFGIESFSPQDYRGQ